MFAEWYLGILGWLAGFGAEERESNFASSFTPNNFPSQNVNLPVQSQFF